MDAHLPLLHLLLPRRLHLLVPRQQERGKQEQQQVPGQQEPWQEGHKRQQRQGPRGVVGGTGSGRPAVGVVSCSRTWRLVPEMQSRAVLLRTRSGWTGGSRVRQYCGEYRFPCLDTYNTSLAKDI